MLTQLTYRRGQCVDKMPFNSVLVTGANRGLGLEFVRQFATQRDGPRHVFACYREWSKAKELAEIAEGAKNGVRVHPVSMGKDLKNCG